MGNPQWAFCRETLLEDIYSSPSLWHDLLDHGTGLAALSLHLGAWPGLAFGNEYFSNRAIIGSKGIRRGSGLREPCWCSRS